MKQKIILLFFNALVLSGLFIVIQTEAEQPVRYEAEDVYLKAIESVFYLRNLGEYDTLRSVGSGVMMDEQGLALTAYHVVKNTVRLEAVLQDGRTITDITIEAYDEGNDVAWLRFPTAIEGELYNALPARAKKLISGETVYAMGYPLKETALITQGIINASEAQINGSTRVFTSAQIVSGMSGGPVIDQEGNVAGIISGSLRTMPGIHSIIAMEHAKALYLTED